MIADASSSTEAEKIITSAKEQINIENKAKRNQKPGG